MGTLILPANFHPGMPALIVNVKPEWEGTITNEKQVVVRHSGSANPFQQPLFLITRLDLIPREDLQQLFPGDPWADVVTDYHKALKKFIATHHPKLHDPETTLGITTNRFSDAKVVTISGGHIGYRYYEKVAVIQTGDWVYLLMVTGVCSTAPEMENDQEEILNLVISTDFS